MKAPCSQAEKVANISFITALLLLLFFPKFVTIPLIFFLCCCFVAPFLPEWAFFLPIISKGQRGSKGIALTFDDGPSPETTPMILELLERYNFKATFFVIGEKAEKSPDLIRDILAADHSIGNHSWKHDSLLMLRSQKTLHKDIQKSQQLLSSFGFRPLLFRPPVGITNPLLKSVLETENLETVTFSCRAFDGGNKRVTGLAKRILGKMSPGNILLLHDLPPHGVETVSALEDELTELFNALQKNECEVLPLEVLIGKPVMKT